MSAFSMMKAPLVAGAVASMAHFAVAKAPTTVTSVDAPEPILPGVVENCDEFYFVEAGDSCHAIARAEGISIDQIIEWNPEVGTECTGLWANFHICVGVAGDESSPTDPDNGVETPEPIQPDLVDNCEAFYLVQGGDACGKIAADHGISVEQFIEYNPSVGETCAGLWADHYACVGVIGGPEPTSGGPGPSPTSGGNGITTPTPTQAEIIDDCDEFYLVQRGENCASIAEENNISLEQFQEWNPSVGEECAGLWADAYACVSRIGVDPSPTDPDNGVSTPEPIQDGMVDNCDEFHFVEAGDSCAAIAERYDIELSDLTKWNTGIGKDCTGMWAETYVCISTL